MRLYYEGTDITGSVDIVKCEYRDAGGGRSDGMEIILENAGDWMRWGPQRGDLIRVELDGCSTGDMYLAAVLPDSGRYRILASAIPHAARQKKTKSFENMSLSGIMAVCAAECGMNHALFGTDGAWIYPYTIRHNESAPAFLSRILLREGCALKAFGGRLNAISINYAQDLSPIDEIELSADNEGVYHVVREDIRLSSVSVMTPYASGRAVDTAQDSGLYTQYATFPADDSITAARWARGMLLTHNRTAETLSIASTFRPVWTAFTRVDITGSSDANGEWMIDECIHDFMAGRSEAKLVRCIRTIR